MRRRSVLVGRRARPGRASGRVPRGRSRRQEELQRPRCSSATRRTPTSRRSHRARSRRPSTKTPRRSTYELSYSGLEGTVLQAHIHFGKRAINGGISLFLCANLGNGPAGTPTCPQSGTVSRTVPASPTSSARHRRESRQGTSPSSSPRCAREHVRERPLDEVAGRRDPRPDQVARRAPWGSCGWRREEARRSRASFVSGLLRSRARCCPITARPNAAARAPSTTRWSNVIAIVPCSPTDDFAVANDGARRDAADAEDRDLRVVDDRRLEEPGELPRARDRERRATHLVRRDRARPAPASASRSISAWISATDFSRQPRTTGTTRPCSVCTATPMSQRSR